MNLVYAFWQLIIRDRQNVSIVPFKVSYLHREANNLEIKSVALESNKCAHIPVMQYTFLCWLNCEIGSVEGWGKEASKGEEMGLSSTVGHRTIFTFIFAYIS